jgi:pyrimidine-nucleoside phosphorylase
MRIVDVIEKKKRGQALTKEEIAFFLNGYIAGDIPDYQATALLMAIWFRGMDERETTDLTMLMADSGDTIDLSAIPGIKVDKHSTGGVADTTTLIVGPLVAACGGKVAKMSGRGLGHTGGTIDKLEAIPGFDVDQPFDRFVRIVSREGVSIIGQTANLVPADRKLYALRDVTATVDNLSLIASSIMSKKLAAGCDAILLDVKAGSGAFMKTPQEAEKLARLMVSIGNRAGKKTKALVTDMNQPLGNAVGNALEVREAIEILQGRGGGDLKTVAVTLASHMLVLATRANDEKEAQDLCEEALENGRALRAFGAMVKAQGGNPEVTEDVGLLPQAAHTVEVTADRSGWVASVNAEAVGTAAMLLGAGRMTLEDRIDPAVGLWMKKRLRDPVDSGEPLAVFHVNDENRLQDALAAFKDAVTVSSDKSPDVELIHALIE